MDEKTKQYFDQKIREVAYQVNQATKKENSGLVVSLKTEIKHITEGIGEIKVHITNTDKAVNANTTHRIETVAKTSVWKYIVSIIGLTNIGTALLYIFNVR